MSEIVKAQYVYITVPKKDIKLYHRLLSLIADYGEARLKDCTPECNKKNQQVITLYNMFHAAIAAKQLSRLSLYNAIITYIEATLDCIYKGTETLPDFIYESDFNDNVLIDIENNLLITEDGTYTISEYVIPVSEDGRYYTVKIKSFSYPKASSSGGILRPTIEYELTTVVHYDDDTENVSTETFSTSIPGIVQLSFQGSNVNVNTGELTVSSSTIENEHIIGNVVLNVNVIAEGSDSSDSAECSVIQEAYTPDEPEPEVPVLLREYYADFSITLFEYPTVSANGGTITPSLEYDVKRVRYYSNNTEEVQMLHCNQANSPLDINITYTGPGVDERNGKTYIPASTQQTNHIVKNVTVRVSSSNSPTEYDQDSTDIIQAAYIPQTVFFAGCSNEAPITYAQLGNAIQFTGSSKTITLSQETRCRWVALPPNLSIQSWKDNVFSSDIPYTTGSTIEIDNITYTIYNYNSILPIANNPHTIIIRKN